MQQGSSVEEPGKATDMGDGLPRCPRYRQRQDHVDIMTKFTVSSPHKSAKQTITQGRQFRVLGQIRFIVRMIGPTRPHPNTKYVTKRKI